MSTNVFDRTVSSALISLRKSKSMVAKLWLIHVNTQPLVMGKAKKKEVYHVGMSCLRGQACRITFF